MNNNYSPSLNLQVDVYIPSSSKKLPIYCPGPAHSESLARHMPLYFPCFGFSRVYRAITPPRGSSVSPWQLHPLIGSFTRGCSKLGLINMFVPLIGGLYATNGKRRSWLRLMGNLNNYSFTGFVLVWLVYEKRVLSTRFFLDGVIIIWCLWILPSIFLESFFSGAKELKSSRRELRAFFNRELVARVTHFLHVLHKSFEFWIDALRIAHSEPMINKRQRR